MRLAFLTLAMMFLVFSFCWATKKDSDELVLDGNHANSFLVQKRGNRWSSWCASAQSYAETMREGKISMVFAPTADVHEECCDEGCDTEEVNENMHPSGYSNMERAEENRELYLKRCC